MAHQEQRDFIIRLRSRFPHWFANRKVLSAGSLNINGDSRDLFANCQYTGIDIVAGPNVDHVSLIHEWQGGPYDTIVSEESLEHDCHFAESMRHMIDLLTDDGPLIITCATDGREEHGTTEHQPWASPGTSDYYRNVPAAEMSAILDANFRCWSVEKLHGDLYAWAVDKKVNTHFA